MHLRHFLLVVFVHQVDRFPPDHAGHHAIARRDRDALRSRDHRIDTTDRVDMQEPVVGDVINDKPDLIAVPGEHHARPAVRIAHAEDIAHDVRADAIAPGRDSVSDELLNIMLIARRTGRFDKLFEKLFAVGVHENWTKMPANIPGPQASVQCACLSVNAR